MNAVLWLLDNVIYLYIYIVIASVILSWLVNFRVINTQNRLVYAVMDFCWRATEPALAPIRRVLPSLGGLDLSPMVLIFGLIFIHKLLFQDILPALYR